MYELLAEYQRANPRITIEGLIEKSATDTQAHYAVQATGALFVEHVYRKHGVAGLRALKGSPASVPEMLEIMRKQLGLPAGDRAALERWWRDAASAARPVPLSAADTIEIITAVLKEYRTSNGPIVRIAETLACGSPDIWGPSRLEDHTVCHSAAAASAFRAHAAGVSAELVSVTAQIPVCIWNPEDVCAERPQTGYPGAGRGRR